MKTNLVQKMKSVVPFSLLLLGVLFMSWTLISCEAEDEGESVNCEAQIVELAEIMNEKTALFQANPTPSTCSALKQSALNLINKAKECGYEEQWAPVTASWEAIDCSEF